MDICTVCGREIDPDSITGICDPCYDADHPFTDAPNGYGNPDDDDGELNWFLASGRIIA
jgi:hypothetical protein